MPSPDSLGASGRYIEIDLTEPGLTFPLLFQPIFAEKYPGDPTLAGQAVSRTIVADGAGDIELIGTLHGVTSVIPFDDGEGKSVQAMGIHALPSGTTQVQVYL